MKRFKNILLLYDGAIGSDIALERAQTLARRNAARLSIIDVVQQKPRDLFSRLVAPRPEEHRVHRHRLSERRLLLQRLSRTLGHDLPTVTVDVLEGIPFVETIRKVLRDDHDLVIMAADGWTGVRPFTFGSTSMHLLRKCPCPVWVITPDSGARFERILAAIDPADAADLAHGLDRRILELSSSLSHGEDCDLDIVHAWDWQGREREIVRSGITEQMADGMLQRATTGYETAIRDLLAEVDLKGREPTIHLPRGEAWAEIPRIAEARQVDLIVMGTVTRTGIAGLFVGDNAELVLQQVTCSVLAVKPDGFETPVALETADWMPHRRAS